MIVFIKLVKRASILHEKIFIYKDQLTSQYQTILITPYQPYQLNNTSQFFNEHILTPL